MSNERLEEMNKLVQGLTDSDGDFADVVKMDVDTYAWFYKQAERVEELEYDFWYYFIKANKLEKQNKRYREAIAKIKESPRKAHSGSDCVDIIFEIIKELESEIND